jgi:hypothetical protein
MCNVDKVKRKTVAKSKVLQQCVVKRYVGKLEGKSKPMYWLAWMASHEDINTFRTNNEAER